MGTFLQASQALSSSGRWQKASGGLWPGVVPSTRNNLRGASDLLEESSCILQGAGPWSTGLLAMPTQDSGHESKLLESTDPDILPIGNGVEGLWVTGPGVSKKIAWVQVGESVEASP